MFASLNPSFQRCLRAGPVSSVKPYGKPTTRKEQDKTQGFTPRMRTSQCAVTLQCYK